MLSDTDAEERLRQYTDAVRRLEFNDPVQSMFLDINDIRKGPREAKKRRLFALKRFVFFKYSPRHGKAWIEGRWSMTDAEHTAWSGTASGRLKNDEVRGVRRRFDRDNSPYRLRVTSSFRPLEGQVDNWLLNSGAGKASEKFWKKALKEIKKQETGPSGKVDAYPDLGAWIDKKRGILFFNPKNPHNLSLPFFDPMVAMAKEVANPGQWATEEARLKAVQKFVEFLKDRYHHGVEITVATPGLSEHGVGSAVDFRVVDGAGNGVCGASGSSRPAWRESREELGGRSLARGLANAMAGAPHFSGPLLVPDEPWHWTFSDGE